MHDQIEQLGGGKFQLDVKGFDVLHQQVLLNSQAKVSAYDLIPVDLPQFGEYRDILMDLTPLIKKSNYDPSDFQKAAWEGAQQGGMQLGFPVQPQPEIFAYRKDIFEKYGLKPPETTDEMLEAAKKLNNAEPGMAGMCWNGQRGTPLGQAFIQILGSYGQPPINEPKKGDHDFDISDLKAENMHPLLDTEKALKVAKLLKDLKPYAPPGVLNMAWGDSYNTMAAGGCAMGYVWSGYSGTWENDPKSPAKGKMVYLPHPRGLGFVGQPLPARRLVPRHSQEHRPGASRACLERAGLAQQSGDDGEVHRERRLRSAARERIQHPRRPASVARR